MDTKLLSYLQRICSRREYCSSDLAAKIKSYYKEGTVVSDCQIVELLDSLRKDKFFDDTRYAHAFAKDKAIFNAWGPYKIRQALRIKGIEDSLIDSALSDSDTVDASLEKLRTQLLSKYKAVKDEPDCKIKLIRFALSKGFDYETVSSMIDRLCAK